MNCFLKPTEEVLANLKTTENGLSSSEAEKRLLEHGKNKLEEAKKDSALKRFVNQMKDPMIIILIVAAAVSAVTDIIEAGKAVVPTDSPNLFCKAYIFKE